MDMTFPEKLALLCRVHDYNRRSLAAALGDVSKSKVHNWLKGDFVPDIHEAAKLADLFSVTVDYLARDELEESPKSEQVTDDERLVLNTLRDLGLTRVSAIRALANAMRDEMTDSGGWIDLGGRRVHVSELKGYYVRSGKSPVRNANPPGTGFTLPQAKSKSKHEYVILEYSSEKKEPLAEDQSERFLSQIERLADIDKIGRSYWRVSSKRMQADIIAEQKIAESPAQPPSKRDAKRKDEVPNKNGTPPTGG